MQRTRRKVWIAGALAAGLLILVLVHLFERKPTAHGGTAQVVKVAKAVRGDMPETLSELGTVTPIATVTVLPQLSGYLTEVGYQGGPRGGEGPVPRANRPASVRDRAAAGASGATQGSIGVGAGPLRPGALPGVARAEGHRRADRHRQ